MRWHWLLSFGVLVWSDSAWAHHEAIFGPQSSLVLGAPGFGSLQVFTKSQGAGGARRQETTGLLSAGFSPFQNIPLSFGITVPASYQAGSGPTRQGLENVPIGARYRFDLEGLQERLGKDAN